MKKTSKILAVVLTLIMLLSTAPLFASAAGVTPDAAKSQAIKEASIFDGDELKIDKTVRVNIGDTVKFSKIAGADTISAYCIDSNGYCIEINYNEDIWSDESFTAVEYGVTVVTVSGYKEVSYVEFGETYYDYEYCGEYTWAIVVVDPEGMGSVTDVTAFDETFRYKETWDPTFGYYTYAGPYVETKNDDYAYYTVIYAPDDYYNSAVYEDGMVDTTMVGSSHCTVYVVDAAGHIFQDTCTITVKYTWWQWLIRIILLGFLWY